MSAGSESDASNGTKSPGSGMLDSVIRIRTLHALSIVVAGVLALSGFFWNELKEMEDRVEQLSDTVHSIRGSRESEFVEPETDEESQNEARTQNSE